MSGIDRRDWLRAAIAGVALVGARSLAAQATGAAAGAQAGSPQQPDSQAAGAQSAGDAAAEQGPTLGGRGDVGTLADPDAVGRPRDRVLPMDNDAAIRELELGLKCPCPCGLDIYTCRTTDFTCTYSPEAHKQVLAYAADGKSADEIRAAFVAQYGERALMAPVAKGFNLAGYLVPGIAVLTAGAVLTWVLTRRNQVAAVAGNGGAGVGAARMTAAARESNAGVAASAGSPGAGAAAPSVDATPEELEALRRALADDDA